jgi:hypothetical protein
VDVGQRRGLEDGDSYRINNAANIETMRFLNGLANAHRVTEPHPRKTVRGDVSRVGGSARAGRGRDCKSRRCPGGTPRAPRMGQVAVQVSDGIWLVEPDVPMNPKVALPFAATVPL